MSNEKHAEIIAEARDKYTVHDCSECNWRKCCYLNARGFDSDECRKKRQSIALMFGIEDEYFSKLLCRLEAAYKREKAAIEADALSVGGLVGAAHGRELSKICPKTGGGFGQLGNAAKLREAVKCLMDNLNIHLMQPIEQITVNRAELEAMVKDCSEALAAPSRVCDRPDADADYFYRMFAAYVQRKNPVHREPSPLMTCFDAIKFLLMSESEAAK